MKATKRWTHCRGKVAVWKSRLPLNGDWIFVTPTIVSPDKEKVDIADKFSSIDEVKAHLTSEKLSEPGLKLVYERAKEFERSVMVRADHVRGKAATLLGTSSLVSAVLFGILGFMMRDITVNPAWVIVIELILGFEMMCHFIRSLFIAADVMTREVSVEASPSEILAFDSIVVYLKDAISQTIAYGNMTSEYIRKKVNRLIIGQHAFRYGLVYFALLLAVQTASRILNDRGNQDSTTLIRGQSNYIVNTYDVSQPSKRLDTVRVTSRDSVTFLRLKNDVMKSQH